MQRQMLKFSQRAEIYVFIKSAGGVKEDGYWEYMDGWTDQKIADHFKVGVHVIAGIRVELGKLKKSVGHLTGPRFVKLEATVLILQRELREMEHKLNSIEAFAKRQGWHIPAKVST